MVRVGINGFGRIGRTFWRAARGHPDVRVVAVNDLADPATLAHLLRYDSVRGRLPAPVAVVDGALLVDDRHISVFESANPAAVPWGDLGVDVVLESTGRFFRSARVRSHLDAGARRVLISYTSPDPDVVIVKGINETAYDPGRHRIVSPGCCTSNAAAPLVRVLHHEFGVAALHLTSLHSYDATHSSLHDEPHSSPRMGRAGATNLVPGRIRNTTRVLDHLFPDLAGLMESLVVRVPVAIGCAIVMVVRIRHRTAAEEVNAALAEAAAGELAGCLGYTEEALVSTDIIGAAESSIVDGSLTSVVDDTVELLAWYDNEWGYANRLVEVAALIGAG
jgi:glyceraldehyde 3-phosphate dehydrogenase